MPQHAHATMTTEQLDVLTVAGHLDLDGLEQLQQRLDDMPCQRARRVRHERHRAEPSAALDSGSIVGGFRPGPRRSANQQTRRGVSDTITARERGPIVCTGIGGPDCSPPPPPPRPSRTAAAVMTSSPDDTARDDTAQDDTAPGTVREPFVPSAKIAVPQLPPEFVVRPALRADLDAADPAEVGLVCAPAGYGKTLLLADWARTSTGADVAWVGLDRDDNDPKRLWASVVAAVAACPSVPADSRLHGPWLLAACRRTGISRRTRGCAAAAAPAGQVDPRRRARTGRPRRPARPPDLHAEPAGRGAARPGQPPRPAAVAAAAASGGPAVGVARRADAVLAGRGGHAARPVGR